MSAMMQPLSGSMRKTKAPISCFVVGHNQKVVFGRGDRGCERQIFHPGAQLLAIGEDGELIGAARLAVTGPAKRKRDDGARDGAPIAMFGALRDPSRGSGTAQTDLTPLPEPGHGCGTDLAIWPGG